MHIQIIHHRISYIWIMCNKHGNIVQNPVPSFCAGLIGIPLEYDHHQQRSRPCAINDRQGYNRGLNISQLNPICPNRGIPSGKLTVYYWKWPIEIVDLPIQHDDFPVRRWFSSSQTVSLPGAYSGSSIFPYTLLEFPAPCSWTGHTIQFAWLGNMKTIPASPKVKFNEVFG